MTVIEFVTEYKKLTTESAKEKFFKSHIKTYYIEYAEKIAICERIINRSMYKTVNEKQIFSINTPTRYMLFMLSIVEKYMDLELQWDKILIDFDIIEKNKIGTLLISYVQDCEVTQTVLKMMVDDRIDSERNMINYLDTKIDALKLVLDSSSEILSPMMSQLVDMKKD